jgi:abhydrolase domain-containing protein 6
MIADLYVDTDSSIEKSPSRVPKMVNYLCQGGGPPVLLVHGIAASRCDWSSLGPVLADHGYRACSLDLLGHGESAKPEDPRNYHILSLVEHFSAWVESLDLEEAAVLVGHSLGGYISLAYAYTHPEMVRGMVLIDPFYSPNQLSPFLRLVRRRPQLGEKVIRITPEWIINMVMGWDSNRKENFSQSDRQQIANDYKRASPHIVYITQSVPDLTPNLSRITTPTLVIWGDEDRTLNPASFNRLVRSLPDARAQIMHGSGHQPHIGKPRVLNGYVLDFLQWLSIDDRPLPR